MRTAEEIENEYLVLCFLSVTSRGEEIARDAARMALGWARGDNVYSVSEQIKRDLFFFELEEKDWNVTETKRT